MRQKNNKNSQGYELIFSLFTVFGTPLWVYDYIYFDLNKARIFLTKWGHCNIVWHLRWLSRIPWNQMSFLDLFLQLHQDKMNWSLSLVIRGKQITSWNVTIYSWTRDFHICPDRVHSKLQKTKNTFFSSLLKFALSIPYISLNNFHQ